MQAINGEWELRGMPCYGEHVDYYQQDWAMIQCKVYLARRPLFYVFNMGMPVLCLMMIGKWKRLASSRQQWKGWEYMAL